MFKGLFRKITEVVTRRRHIDESLFDELEEAMIEGDVGVQTSMRLVKELREATRRKRLQDGDQVAAHLREQIQAILEREDRSIRWGPDRPTLIMVVGINGTGKTTSIAKLTRWLLSQRKRVLVAAGDTFRAAAIDQLEVWAQRLNVEIVKHKEGADPAAVVFDAVQAARARGIDVVIADTAGRLHTQTNLMEELKKVARVAERALGREPDEVLLVLDATLGQNAVNQAKAFAEALPVTGIMLTKMDGTARGGVIVTVKDELGIPIKFVGTGEKPENFAEFDPTKFAADLFGDEE